MIPELEQDGNLPPGIHWTTWKELSQRFGNTPHRRRLLAGLKAALEELGVAGCKAVYIDGSFVTGKEIPADYDACWDMSDVDPTILDPVLLKFDDGRLAMNAKYRGDLFPEHLTEGATGKPFLEFFMEDKESGKPKGILAIDPQGEL